MSRTPEPETILFPPYGLWRRTLGNQWMPIELRALVAEWASLFVSTHNWTDRWEIIEQIGSASMLTQLRRSLRWQYQAPNYEQRHGAKELVLRFHRPYLTTRYAEVGLTFVAGADTAIEQLATLLDVAKRSAESQA